MVALWGVVGSRVSIRVCKVPLGSRSFARGDFGFSLLDASTPFDTMKAVHAALNSKALRYRLTESLLSHSTMVVIRGQL